MEYCGVWQSREEGERQKELEKLIDWEVSKQLTWVVLVLTFLLGAIELLASRLVKSSEAISFKSSFLTIEVYANPSFVIIYILMILGLDMSFYRLATSLVRLRNWEQMLPSEFKRKQLVEKVPLDWFYGLFRERTDQNSFSLKAWFVWLLIVLGDILLIWALVSV